MTRGALACCLAAALLPAAGWGAFQGLTAASRPGSPALHAPPAPSIVRLAPELAALARLAPGPAAPQAAVTAEPAAPAPPADPANSATPANPSDIDAAIRRLLDAVPPARFEIQLAATPGLEGSVLPLLGRALVPVQPAAGPDAALAGRLGRYLV